MRVSGRDGWMPSSFVIDRGIASRRARAHGEAERLQELAAQDLAGVRGDAVRRGHVVKISGTPLRLSERQFISAFRLRVGARRGVLDAHLQLGFRPAPKRQKARCDEGKARRVPRPKLRAVAQGAIKAATEQAKTAIGELAERNLGR